MACLLTAGFESEILVSQFLFRAAAFGTFPVQVGKGMERREWEGRLAHCGL